VVRTVCKDSRASLVALKSEGDGGLLVTPYHPVRLDSQAPWTFPIDLAPASDMYSFRVIFDIFSTVWLMVCL